jgi:hypothetical protein
MAKQAWAISILFIGCLIGLAGCTEKTVRNIPLEEKVTESQKEPEKNPQIEISKEVQKPIVVNVVDPNTKDILRTFIPADIRYGTTNEKYKQEVQKWAKDLARGTENAIGYDQRMVLDKLDAKGQIIKGKPKIILEEAELVTKVMEASVKDGDIDIPLYVTESGYKPEDAQPLG